MLHFPGDLAGTLGLNYSIPSNSCLWRKFTLGKNGLQVMVDRIHPDLEQVRHQFLREPDGFFLHAHLQPRASVLRLVKKKFAARRGCG